MSNVTVSREALYELVWSKPTTIVAREFEVSDVAVIKVCRKLNVPRPPRGYWARRRHGYAVMDAPPLPARNDDTPPVHTFTAHLDRPTASRPSAPAVVAVSQSIRQSHPMLTSMKAALAKSRPDRCGRVGPSDTGINVSPSMVSRAVKLLSLLFEVLEAQLVARFNKSSKVLEQLCQVLDRRAVIFGGSIHPDRGTYAQSDKARTAHEAHPRRAQQNRFRPRLALHRRP